MHHVVFEVLPAASGREPYLAMAARLKPLMEASGGCVLLERFDCDDAPGWMLSMQRWRDEASLERWRAHADHCVAQRAGRERVFDDYRLRIATQRARHATRGELPSQDGARAWVPVLAPLERGVLIAEWTAPADPQPAASSAARAAFARALARAPQDSRRYTAILDPSRHALVSPNLSTTGPDGDALAVWCDELIDHAAAAALPFELSLVQVDRDYGRFDRAEAPLALG